MSEEVDLAAKATGEVVAALASESGVFAVPREYARYIETRIHLRHLPALVERTMAAAEKINASGLPSKAFDALDEPLLTAILKSMAEETDPELQPVWENLLVNAVVEGGAEARRAFPKILAELEPAEAHLLDTLVPEPERSPFSTIQDVEPDSSSATLFDNLERLGLIRYEPGIQDPDRVYTSIDELSAAMRERCNITSLGQALVSACRAPHKPESNGL